MADDLLGERNGVVIEASRGTQNQFGRVGRHNETYLRAIDGWPWASCVTPGFPISNDLCSCLAIHIERAARLACACACSSSIPTAGSELNLEQFAIHRLHLCIHWNGPTPALLDGLYTDFNLGALDFGHRLRATA